MSKKRQGLISDEEWETKQVMEMEAAEGRKDDQAKTQVELLSPWALEEMAKAFTFGASKYDAHNYLRGMRWTRLLGSTLRHVYAWARGENRDPESGLSHLAHAGCCIMMLLDFEIHRLGTDDRWTP